MQAFLIAPESHHAPLPDTVMAVPVVTVPSLEDHYAQSEDLRRLSLVSNGLFAVYFGAASFHLCQSPLPVEGGRGEHIPISFWFVLLLVVFLLKLLGRRPPRNHWRVRAARLSCIVWATLSVCTMLPGVPVMTWVFGPLFAAIDFVLFTRIERIESAAKKREKAHA